MKGDKDKLISQNSSKKEKNVTFGNDSPAVVKGKGSIFIKEKVKVGNVMYVDVLKHNLLSVSQMYDQGDIGKTIIKGTRTLINLYILKGGQEQCYLGKAEED